MKLYEIFLNLFELRGDRYADVKIGYIHSKTGEVIPSDPNKPHVTLIALHPQKFNVPQNMRHLLPPPPDAKEIFYWADENDALDGPWQHVAYEAGWVRYVHFGWTHGFSGYKEGLANALSLPGVVRTIIRHSREDPMVNIMVDIVSPDVGGDIDSDQQDVRSAGDVAKLVSRLY